MSFLAPGGAGKRAAYQTVLRAFAATGGPPGPAKTSASRTAGPPTLGQRGLQAEATGIAVCATNRLLQALLAELNAAGALDWSQA